MARLSSPATTPAGTRAIPPHTWPGPANAAASRPVSLRSLYCPYGQPSTRLWRPVLSQKENRAKNWKLRGPPAVKSLPAVVSGRPKLDDLRNPGLPTSPLSRAKALAKPELFDQPRTFVTLERLKNSPPSSNLASPRNRKLFVSLKSKF